MIAAGQDTHHQLFIEPNTKNADSIECVTPPCGMLLDAKKILSFSTGNSFSVFITTDGFAFGVGDDRDFCIGTSQRVVYNNPTEVTFPDIKEKFVSVHCGSYYTAYLTESGTLIYCSYNSENNEPAIHKLPTKIVYVSGGLLKPVALDENGDIYLFKASPTHAPKKIHLPEPVFDICGCDNVFTTGFNVCVTKSGKVYSNGSFSNESDEFTPVDSLNDIKITRVFGSHRHCFVMTEDGEVMVMGSNVSGQHGNNNTENTNTFSSVKTLSADTIVAAAAGYSHSAFVTSDGKLLTCGSNEFGQLAQPSLTPDAKTPTPVAIDGKVKWVWAGAYSTIALVDIDPPKHRGVELILNHA